MILTPLFTLSLLLRLLLSSLSLSHFQLHHPFNSVGKNMDHCINRSSSWNDDPMQLSPNHLADDDNSNNDDNVEDAVKLLSAPHEGLSAEYVLSILSKNPRLIRFADPVGDNVLHMSARNGDTETVCKLIAFLKERQDEDLKKVLTDVNVNGDTPLHLALMNGHHEISNHLGRANTDAIAMHNNDGTIPFELAEKAGYTGYPWCYYFGHNVVHVVHSSATVKDLTDVSRIFPVHWIELQRAIEKDEEDNLFTGLLRHGKKLLWHHGRGGETLLHKAVRASGMGPLSKLVQFMISNGMTDVAFLKDSYENTALHVAVENKELSKARCLIKAEPRTVYQVNRKGESPLYIAVKDGHTDLVEYMMNDDGLCISASEILWHPKHATLAHLAIRTRSFGILKTLMEHLPDLANLTDEKGWRPLSYAANKGYLEEVTYFLTNFPESAEKYDKDGSLPVHKAVGGDHVSVIKAFYEHCPQTLHHVDRKGRNALQIAVNYDRADIYTCFTKEIKIDDSFSSLKDDDNLVQLTPANLGDKDDNNSDDDMGEVGKYLLCALHEGISADVVLSILSKNPRLIRIANLMGENVLHISARNGDNETVCKLIAFLNKRQDDDLEKILTDANVDGDTPLHLALKNGHREAVKRLVRAGSMAVNIRNNDGITSYGLAMQAGYNDIEIMMRQFVPRPSTADVQIRAIAKDFPNASRELPVYWIELKRAINKGQKDDIITGLMRDGKKLLRHQDRGGETLLHVAVAASGAGPLRELVWFMISNDMTDAALLRDMLGNTALHVAVKNRELTKAHCLIKAEPRTVYKVNNVGVTPLYIAVKDGKHDLVKYMVSHLCLCVSASEILWHPTHATLAHLAIRNRSFGILETLMEHLPELVKSTNDKGWRPLSYAANRGYVEEVTYFLTKFPESADKHDEDGSFPIHKGVGGGHLSVIKAFYEICPQALHHIDRKGRSVLHIAVSYDRADIYTYLTKELKLANFFSSLQDNVGKTFKDYEQKLKI